MDETSGKPSEGLEGCPLGFHIPAPFTCLRAEVAELSPNVAPPPAGKFEELQSSAVTPDTFEK